MRRLIDANELVAEIVKAQESLLSNNDAVWRMNQKYYKGLAWAHRLVIDAPTVDAVEVVHGRWIPCGGCGYRCSNCDFWVAFRSLNNYCPNCGAKMDGDGNE